MKLNRLGLSTTLIGIILQMGGLALDAHLHSNNPNLALEENVFTLTNPAHAVFALGLALTIAGVGALLLASQGLSRRGFAFRAVPLTLVGGLALAAFFFAFGAAPGIEGHQHAAVQTGQSAVESAADHANHAPPASVSAAPQAPAQGGRHEHGPEIKISLSDLGKLQDQLAVARQATDKYQDINVARADGYIQVTQDLPGIAAHFVKPSLINNVFDPARPPALLYSRRLSGSWQLVGIMYLTTPGAPVPEGFAGPLDSWHYHTNLCFVGAVVSGNATAEGCAARGGRFTAQTGWMLHVWLYAESPDGIFSAENPLISIGRLPAGS